MMMMMMSRLGFWTLERGHQHHPSPPVAEETKQFCDGGRENVCTFKFDYAEEKRREDL